MLGVLKGTRSRALDEDRAHDSAAGTIQRRGRGDASDREKGRHLTNPIYKELPNGL